MLDRNLRDRYSRQTIFPGIGEVGQAKLLRSRAVVIGCGALGGNIAGALVRAGVGNVSIVDRDFIEYHNLARQVLFDEEDIREGLPKAVAAARHLARVNSTVKVEGIVADVNFSNVEKLCAGADVILDGLDNVETRFLLNDVALKHKIPWVYGGAIGASGMTMTVVPGRPPCFRCLHPITAAPENAPTCETAGVVGTAPAVIGALQATEALKILVGAAELNRSIIVLDVWRDTFERIRVAPREDCPTCGGRYEFLEKRFTTRVTPLCGQSRAVQVVDTTVGRVDLAGLAAGLREARNTQSTDYQLRFEVDEVEITVFPDGRAIIRNTLDADRAQDLYRQYVRSRV
ncbi:MAG: ThiF family adenylyltransferase [Chloroflexota bacterium]